MSIAQFFYDFPVFEFLDLLHVYWLEYDLIFFFFQDGYVGNLFSGISNIEHIFLLPLHKNGIIFYYIIFGP